MEENGVESTDEKDWEVVEVNFAKSDMKIIPFMFKLTDISDQFNSNEKKIKLSNDFNFKEKLANKNLKLIKNFDKVKKNYVRDVVDFVPQDDDESTYKFAFVTFRSMKATDLIRNSYGLDEIA